jgi:hypothetical protein
VVYVDEGTLFALPFDLKRLVVTGQPAPLPEDVVANPSSGKAQFSFSETGNLVYVPGRAGVWTSPCTGWAARANSRLSARLPVATSISRSPPMIAAWLWTLLTVNDGTYPNRIAPEKRRYRVRHALSVLIAAED